MNCPQCGRENPDTSRFCGGCGAPLGSAAPAPATTDVPPRTSGLAIASLVFGILGLICILPLVGSIVGLILGILALTSIQRSQGTVGGQTIATAGLVISAIGFVLLPLAGALVLPVMVQARENARQAECMSNLRQLGLGTAMYTQDYDERMPLAASWADNLVPYIKNTELFRCRSDRSGQARSYAYNARLNAYPIGKVASPIMTAMLFDARGGATNPSGGENDVAARHREGACIGFVDGHVRWLSADSVGSETVWDPTKLTK